MKTTNLILLIAIFIFSSCSKNLMTISSGKQIDKSLVGVWVGSEKDQQIEGLEKKWEMTRTEDGKFMLDFFVVKGDKSQKTTETGNWWIEKGKFHEFHDVSLKTDVYNYKVLNKDQIKFMSSSLSVEMATDSYEFIDTRKNNPK